MKHSKVLSLPVIVAALGYFVDIYDLVLFSIVRKPSLKAIGLTDFEIEKQGLWILNIQMIGMLVGGILWGVLGDKKGRLSVIWFYYFVFISKYFKCICSRCYTI